MQLLDFINGSNRRARGVSNAVVVLNGSDLSLDDVVHVSRFGARVELTDAQIILNRVDAAHDYIVRATQEGRAIYGVTTGRIPAAIDEMLTNNTS